MKQLLYSSHNVGLHLFKRLNFRFLWIFWVPLSFGLFLWTFAVWLTPAHRGVNDAQIDLGHRLFFERALSKGNAKSCASCHDPKFAFTDRYRRGLGLYADNLPHNTPSLINVRFYRSFNWASPEITTLEAQMERPLFSQHPPEMGMSKEDTLSYKRLAQVKDYNDRFKAAFPMDKQPITWTNIIQAIAAYQRTLVSFNAPFDRFKKGDEHALNAAAKRGYMLFSSSRLQCITCHPPPYFTDHNIQSSTIGFHDIGYTGNSVTDRTTHTFRTPSLRNVAITAPYMHDGGIESLNNVIRFFETGGEDRDSKDPLMKRFSLSDSERTDMLAFLESLTDSTIFTNPHFQPPKSHE